MTEVFVARQAIYNHKHKVEAYEILYRSTEEQGCRLLDGERATSEVLLHTLNTIGLERLVGTHPAFINVTRDILLSDRLAPLAGGRIVLEVLEDVAVDEALLSAVRSLSSAGFRIALDDFACNEASWPLVPLADFVKLDVLATPERSLREWVPRLHAQGVKLIAEKIETEAQYAPCRRLGFDYYQGNYFSQPDLVRGSTLHTDRFAILQLIGKLNDPDVSLESIESLITQDVSLSYKLLRHVNSAYFGLAKRVESIRRAVLLLGLNTIKSLATLLAIANLDDSRSDLTATALVRAKMCEYLAAAQGLPQQDSCFTVGLLSILEVMIQAPMAQILESLPMTREINKALLHRKGPMGRILACTLAYERGDWGTVLATSAVSPLIVSDAYFAALHNANIYQASLKSLYATS